MWFVCKPLDPSPAAQDDMFSRVLYTNREDTLNPLQKMQSAEHAHLPLTAREGEAP